MEFHQWNDESIAHEISHPCGIGASRKTKLPMHHLGGVHLLDFVVFDNSKVDLAVVESGMVGGPFNIVGVHARRKPRDKCEKRKE